MKVKAKYFREIEYVEVKDLPQEQQLLLSHYKEADYIKILIEDKVVGPCLQYSQYELWYNSLRIPKMSEEVRQQSHPVSQLLVNKL
ncbi:hypothetical protein SanaruYs_12370 [Chryseotalea sanaruensis]|uniref:Uncharacterized protein n=1 Tax=Chryseotalea sanaruensis TaxID=2482724 RepID=A0A401U812_9BACT|nr:hypothetical protein [Chryseotalea sanaruensis]GCC51017.1 hypothetical protein SanaruYs_12370 [Chryseotalea sanaruensis]